MHNPTWRPWQPPIEVLGLDERPPGPAKPTPATAGETKLTRYEREGLHGMTPQEYVQSDQCLIDHTAPVLEQKIDQIKAHYDEEMRSLILKHYELGLLVKEVHDDELSNGGDGRYGSQAMKKLCAALPWAKSALYESLRLANTYTREQAGELVEMHLRSGESLTWSHVRTLAMIHDKNTRAELLQRTVEENWTADELGKELERRYQLQSPKKPRRVLAPPSSLSGLIQQQRAYAEDFLKRDESAWKAEGCGLMDRLQELPTEEFTEEGASELKEHAERLRQVAKAAEQEAQSAEVAYQRYLKTLERVKAKLPLAAANALGLVGEEDESAA